MSNYGMLGLLEGAGKGLQQVGNTITANAMQEAQDRREQNRERIRQEYAREEGDRQYTRNRADALTDHTTSLTEEQARYERGITEEDKRYTRDRADSLTDRQWTLDNREPSESDKLIKRADSALAAGTIDKATYNNITLGLSKSGGDLTANDKAKLRMDAHEAASMEIIGKDPMNPATPEQVKAINRRTEEIYNRATGSGGGLLESGIDINPKDIQDIASRIAKADQGQEVAALDDLRSKGTSEAQISVIKEHVKEARKQLTDRNAKDPQWKLNHETGRMEATNPAFLEAQKAKAAKDDEVRKSKSAAYEKSQKARIDARRQERERVQEGKRARAESRQKRADQ